MEQSDCVYIREVLMEKYLIHSIHSMTKWIIKQKHISVRSEKFEDASRWRNLENHINKNFYGHQDLHDELHIKAVKTCCKLFEEML